MVRRKWSAICAALIVFVLGSCGDEGDTAGTDTTVGTGTVSPSVTTTAPPSGTQDTATSGDPGLDLDGTVEEIFAQLGELPDEERLAIIRERAEEEGTLTMYTVSNLEDTEASVAHFQELYGVPVEYIRLEDAAFSDRVLLENQTGQHLVDIMDVSGPDAVRLQSEGMFARLSNAPVAPENYPDSAVTEYGVVHQLNPLLMWWNTDLVGPDEAPTELDDFLDPVWRGRVGITSFPDDLTLALIEDRGEEGAREFLTGLVVDNEAVIRQGHSNSAVALIAGEFDAHVGLLASTSLPRIEEGAPIDWAFVEPYPVNLGVTYIYAEAPHPFAALLWMTYKSSLEGQQADADSGSPVLHPDVEQAFEAYAEMNQVVIDGEAMLLTNEIVGEHAATAEALIEEIVVPRFRE